MCGHQVLLPVNENFRTESAGRHEGDTHTALSVVLLTLQRPAAPVLRVETRSGPGCDPTGHLQGLWRAALRPPRGHFQEKLSDATDKDLLPSGFLAGLVGGVGIIASTGAMCGLLSSGRCRRDALERDVGKSLSPPFLAGCLALVPGTGRTGKASHTRPLRLTVGIGRDTDWGLRPGGPRHVLY